MDLCWKTSNETFRLIVCAELSSEKFHGGRVVVEIRDDKDNLVALSDLDGNDTDALSERSPYDPTIAQIEAIKSWTAPGCAVVSR